MSKLEWKNKFVDVHQSWRNDKFSFILTDNRKPMAQDSIQIRLPSELLTPD